MPQGMRASRLRGLMPMCAYLLKVVDDYYNDMRLREVRFVRITRDE
jgi:hypothetical protein